MLRGLGARGDAGRARRSSPRPARTPRVTTRIPAMRSTPASSTTSRCDAAMPLIAEGDVAVAPDGAARCARAPAAAREPDAADRRVQLFAGARMGGRGGNDPRCGERRKPGSATLLAGRRQASARRAVRGGFCAPRARGDWPAIRCAGTRGSARRARPRSCAPRREQMGGSLARLLRDLDAARRAGARDAAARIAPVTLPAAYRARRARVRGSGASRADRVSVVVAREPGARRRSSWCRSDRSADSGCCSRSARGSRRWSPVRATLADDDLSRVSRRASRSRRARHETQYTRLFRS